MTKTVTISSPTSILRAELDMWKPIWRIERKMWGDEMAKTMKIALTENEMRLLRKSAALDCRRTQEQARYLIRCALLGDGRLTTNDDAAGHLADSEGSVPHVGDPEGAH